MTLRIAAYCLLGGLAVTIAALGAGHFGWWWASGVLLAAAFVPVARFGPRGLVGQVGVIAPVLIVVTVVTTWSEAFVFFPSARQNAVRGLIGALVMYMIFAAGLALLAWVLRITKESTPAPELRPKAAIAFRILLCGGAYAVYYLVTGSLTYRFFTKGYYPEAEQIVSQLGVWFWAMQVGRGILMTLAVLPIVSVLRMERWRAALAVGVLIWVAGGAAPLLTPNPLMVPTQRMIHIAEILTQNLPLGITAVLLFRRPKKVAPLGRRDELVLQDPRSLIT